MLFVECFFRINNKMCDLTFGIITVSDTCSQGLAVDLSGPHLQKLIDDKFGVKNVVYSLIPDEIDEIEVKYSHKL